MNSIEKAVLSFAVLFPEKRRIELSATDFHQMRTVHTGPKVAFLLCKL